MTKKKTISIRQIILDRLKELGKTVYWLSCRQTTLHELSIRKFLYGERKTHNLNMRAIEEIFMLLDLEIRRAEPTAKKPEEKPASK